MTRRRLLPAVVAGLGALLVASACVAPGGRAAPTASVTTSTSPTSAVPTAPATAGAAAPSVRFSAVGDIGSSTAASAVLKAIGARHGDFTLALGDLSYGAAGAEDTWCRFVTSRVGTTHPFELVSGNHESNGANGHIDRFVRCLPNRLPGLVGTYGRQWYVDQPAGAPLVRVVMVSPGLDFGSGPWSYAEGTARYRWLEAAVTGARAAGIPWVVVGMHKPCLSVGEYSCDPGADVVELMMRTGVDLVLTGHEHLYQRTKPLALGLGCQVVRPGVFVRACFAAHDGTTFVTVGTGGIRLRAASSTDTERRYFATVSGSNTKPSHGSLDVVVTRDRLTATFVPVSGGTFTDQVVLTP
ncbi:metallophosphoesterase [Oryzobacter telluris]|uniref:metallophosphoesterase n=1 Tax=Oryzobacter telluris TaxID=3149179 RepID=UPI00370DBEFD